MIKMPKKIETDRLFLVPMSLDYADDVFREFTPEIAYFMSPPSPKKIEETTSWIETTILKYQDGIDFTFAIILKDTGEFIGGGGIHHMDRLTPELGIWTKKSSHGNKYGREAIQGAKKWADKNLEYEYIKYPVAVKNIASSKIPESLGGKVYRKFYDKNGAGKKMLLAEYRIYK